MRVNIFSYRNRKFAIWFAIFLAFTGIYVIIRTVDNYFNSIKQSNIYLRRPASKGDPSYIQRAILIFYPSNQESHFNSEIRWLYRSWIEMIKYEPKHWRTDLVIFTANYNSSFQQLGCMLNEIRINITEQPRCRIFLYRRLSDREINHITQKQTVFVDDIQSITNLYTIDFQRSKLLYNNIKAYEYFDSVNIIAESYPIYECYDFILKTDIDVFITKQFGKYIPQSNMTLLVGRGGYSTTFNTGRLRRIARDMGWHYQNLTNIGSTWYGSPHIANRIANFALDAMLHLSDNEFTVVERSRKLGVLLWPDWHYGVLSMYGTHLAVNHLVVTEKLDIKKADQLLDQSTTNKDPYDIEKNNRLHLHCWHTDEQFSKFQFKAGKYNHIHPRTLINHTSAQAYATRMALESRLMTLEELGQYLVRISNEKFE